MHVTLAAAEQVDLYQVHGESIHQVVLTASPLPIKHLKWFLMGKIEMRLRIS